MNRVVARYTSVLVLSALLSTAAFFGLAGAAFGHRCCCCLLVTWCHFARCPCFWQRCVCVWAAGPRNPAKICPTSAKATLDRAGL